MALHTFVSGESAQVAENLDANFQFLLNLITSGGSGGSIAAATGTSSTNYLIVQNFTGTGTIVGSSTATGHSSFLTSGNLIATATGSSTAAFIGSDQSASVATATGTSSTAYIENNGTTATAAATGTSATSYIGSANSQPTATATGTSTATATSIKQIASVATAQGQATGAGVGQGGGVESLSGTISTGPTPVIFASNTPGTASSTLNSFTLSASPGTIVYNGSNDTTVPNAVELYYNAHVLYVENVNGNWFQWASADVWNPTANPLPVTVEESVEGLFYTTSGNIIYASTTPGTAAPAGSTVGHGLDTWAMTANPGLLIHNGVNDTNTANVIEIYYHNHTLWQENSGLSWFTWTNNVAVNNGYASQTSGPVPTTSAINVAIVPNQITNQTFYVSGSYQDYTGGGTPTLQYADNYTGTGTGTTTWNPADKSAGITLTNSNETATTTVNAVSTSVRSTTSYSSGKRIFEVTMSTITSNFEIGIADSTYALASGLGDTTDSFGFQPNQAGGALFIFNGAVVGTTVTGHNSANGDKATFCVDFGNQLIWITSTAMRAAGFPWNNVVIGSANPATGVGGLSFSGMGAAGFICFNEFDTGGATVLNTLGPYAVSIPSGFTSWDVASGTTWQALPSSVNVTSTEWSFVHPPVATQNATANVAVRDANSTGIIGTSANFQISSPGVVTLSPMTLSNSTVAAGQPAGTVVGVVTIPVSGGTFTGSVSTNDPSQFNVTGSGSTQNLVTTAVLAANAGIAIVLTATMAGAVNSGETLNATVVVGAESPSASIVTTIGPTIIGSSIPGTAGSSLTWGLVTAVSPATGFQLSLNGTRQTITSAVTELYYINHTLYFQSGSGTWQEYNGGTISGGQLAAGQLTSESTPVPNITLSGLTFSPGKNGDTGISASLISASVAMSGVTWTEDSASFSFVGNEIYTTGALPAGTYPVNITATIA